ncbi:MAG: hypothetical protein DBX47_05625, partial [Clostridiales bacterium]
MKKLMASFIILAILSAFPMAFSAATDTRAQFGIPAAVTVPSVDGFFDEIEWYGSYHEFINFNTGNLWHGAIVDSSGSWVKNACNDSVNSCPGYDVYTTYSQGNAVNYQDGSSGYDGGLYIAVVAQDKTEGSAFDYGAGCNGGDFIQIVLDPLNKMYVDTTYSHLYTFNPRSIISEKNPSGGAAWYEHYAYNGMPADYFNVQTKSKITSNGWVMEIFVPWRILNCTVSGVAKAPTGAIGTQMGMGYFLVDSVWTSIYYGAANFGQRSATSIAAFPSSLSIPKSYRAATFNAMVADSSNALALQCLANTVKGLNKDDYSASSWQTLQLAYKSACVTVKNGTNAATAYTDLNNAYNALTPAATTSVAITGVAQYGNTVTATVTDAPLGSVLHYQWKLDGVDAGTDSATYAIDSASVGKVLTVTVTSEDSSVNITSVPVTVGLQTISITGTSQYGNTVIAAVTDAPANTELYYQWKLDGINVGADSATYLINSASLGKSLSVTATSTDGVVNISSQAISVSSSSVAITGDAKYSKTVTATVYNAPSGVDLQYQWKLDGVNVGKNSPTYTIYADELDKSLTVTVTSNDGSIDITSGAVIPERLPTKAPVAPVLASKTDTSVTLVSLGSREYSKDGINWQTSNVFTGLTPDTEYNFYARLAHPGFDTSAASKPLSVFTEKSTAPISVSLTKTASYGSSVVATVTGAPTGATLKYQWYLDNTPVGTNTDTYTVATGSLGKVISCEVTINGTTTIKSGSVIAKPERAAMPTTIPQIINRTSTTINVQPQAGIEYSVDDGATWNTTGEFTGLNPGTMYTLWSRRVANLPNYIESYALRSRVVTVAQSSDFTVTIEGSGKYCTELTAHISGIDTAGKKITYQWMRGDQISGPNSNKYFCYMEDIGKEVT